VLDVGAGCGKFAIGAARSELEIVGYERDPQLVELATRVAREVHANARFFVGDATRVAWDEFDCVYMFRPLDDDDVDGVTRLEASLDDARIGMVLVTFNRFGGRVPGRFDLISEERV